MGSPFRWDGELPNDVEDRPLPWWRRLALSCVLPTLSLYGSVRLLWWHWLNARKGISEPGSGGDGLFAFVKAEILFGGISMMFVAPAAICALMVTFRPWRRWYTAVAGGLAGVVAGALCGVAAAWILKLLTD